MEDRERYRTGERAIAPIVATVIPALIVTVLMVVTAISSKPHEKHEWDIGRPAEDDPVTPVDDDPPPEPPPEDIQLPDETPDIMVDTDMPKVTTEDLTPQRIQPTAEPVTVKQAPQDAVMPIKCPVHMPSLFAARDTGSRAKYVSGGLNGEYGSTETEHAVMKALRWLKKTQRTDGSWAGNPVSNTGLAVLAYLAHGEVPSKSKEFGRTVELALDYLINAQTGEGDETRFRGADGNEYAFLIATYALSEAYGMTRNPNAKIAAMKGLERIVRNQSPTGGWDYRLNRESTRDDMSFAGWALQALKAGKMAGLHPKGLDECIKKAIKCLKTRNFRNGGFNYCAGGPPTGLTATGCLAMQLLGFMNEPEVKSALDFMREWKPAFEAKGGAKPGGPLPGASPQYYCYYAAQCKYQAGMCQGATPANVKTWQDWNVAMKALYPRSIKTLPETIEGPDGKPRQIGYWPMSKNDGLGAGGGDTMSTCLCALQLMVYYRYLPTTQTKAAKAETTGEEDKKDAKKSNDVDVEVDI